MSTFQSNLRNNFPVRAKSILPQRDIISIHENETLKSALALLNKHSIMSCPVTSKGDEKSSSFIGYVENVELVKEVLIEDNGSTTVAQYLKGKSRQDSAKLDNVPVYLLLEVLSHGQERIPLLSSDDQGDKLISNQISQSDACRYLTRLVESTDKSCHGFGLLASQHLKDLDGLDAKKHSEVVSVKESDSVKEALSILLSTGHKNIPVMAVSSDTNQEEMVNVLGVRSFRATLTQDDLALTIKAYLAKIGQDKPSDSMLYRSPDHCTLKQLMELMSTSGMHQLWLSKNKVPVSTIDLEDILQVFVSVSNEKLAALAQAEQKEADRAQRLIQGQE
jgi:predicted transcriptional regulator